MLTSKSFIQPELNSLKSAIIRDPLTVALDTKVFDAISMMSAMRSICETTRTESSQFEVMELEARSSCVLVLREQKVVGILTERDIVRLTAQKHSLADLLVRDVMTYPVVTLYESAFPDLFFVINLLQKYHIRHIPILDEQNLLVGLVTHESLRQTTSPEDILRSRTVSDVMTQEVIWATPDSSILKITQLMFEHHVSCVVIARSVKMSRIPVGILTERDIVQFQGLGLNLETYLAQEVMSTPIFTVQSEDSLWDIQQKMEQYLIHRLAVTSEQGELIGIVTRTSLLQVLNPLELHKQAEVLEKKVVQLESEKMQLLTSRNLELEQQVEARTFALQEKVKREKLLAELSTQIRASLSLQTILDTTVERVRQLLNCDRVNIIKLEVDGKNIIVAESTDSEISTLGQIVDGIDTNQIRVGCVDCDTDCYCYSVGNIHAITMSAYRQNILTKFKICAQILVPILYTDELWGFLNVIESEKAREWQAEEIELLQSLSVHLAIALHQVNINQKLQDRLNECQLAEMRVRQSEAQSRAILAAIPDLMIRVGDDGVYRGYVTPYQDFSIVPQGVDISGIAITDLLPSEIAEQQLYYLHKALETGELQIYEQQIQVRDRIQDEEVRVIKYGDDEVLFMIRDISDRKKAERDLHKLNQELESKVERRTKQLQQINQELAHVTGLKDEFLANMSHELRTPLNAILGMTDGLKEGFFGEVNEQQLGALKTVESSGSHLLELIDDILDLAKIESGQIELDMTSVPVANLCQSSLAFIKQQALRKRIQLDVKLQLNLPNLLVDERRIRQVLINLLNNAVKFTPEGGSISLEASFHKVLNDQERNYLRISVIDTGIGILSKNIHKLFQPFIQIDSALNREYNGTGLGLALVKRIVELHGGKVELTSEIDVGSCFTVNLPCYPYSPFPIDTTRDDRGNCDDGEDCSIDASIIQNSLILLAEDNIANISMLSKCLETKGYRFLLAKDGQEAIDYAKAYHPDLILMDIQMPRVNGIEAIQQIRGDRNLVNTPIIALTALAMAGDRERCLAAGANEYLAKPVKIRQLERTIQRFLFNKDVNK
jgi:signal transduction histidine kinase/CBS domain-containing protein/ActR/RegA family two-component response regulator